MGDRIGIMRSGRLEQVGAPDEIYARPATRFVASFIGSPPMNLLQGAVVEESGRPVFTASGVRIDLGANAEIKSGAVVTLGVRPEHLAVATGGASAALFAKVFAVEHLGRESILIADSADGTRIRAVLEPGAGPRIGDDLSFAVRPGATVHLFDDKAAGQPVLARLTL